MSIATMVQRHDKQTWKRKVCTRSVTHTGLYTWKTLKKKCGVSMNMRAFVYALSFCFVISASHWKCQAVLATVERPRCNDRHGFWFSVRLRYSHLRWNNIETKHGRVMKERCATIRFVNLYSRNGAVAEAVWVSKMLLFTKT